MKYYPIFKLPKPWDQTWLALKWLENVQEIKMNSPGRTHYYGVANILGKKGLRQHLWGGKHFAAIIIAQYEIKETGSQKNLNMKIFWARKWNPGIL